jgi:hypothetical protein
MASSLLTLLALARLTGSLQDSEDLVSGNALDLSNTVAIPEDNADLGWGHSLSCKLVDLVADFLRSGL